MQTPLSAELFASPFSSGIIVLQICHPESSVLFGILCKSNTALISMQSSRLTSQTSPLLQAPIWFLDYNVSLHSFLNPLNSIPSLNPLGKSEA